MPADKNADYRRMGKYQTKNYSQITILLLTILLPFGRKVLIWIKWVGPESYRRHEVLEALSYN